jgi:hypothetical protein
VRNLEDVVSEAQKKGKARELDELTRPDYLKNTNRMRRILRMLRDANIHVIITALPKTLTEKIGSSQDAPEKVVGIVPSLTKALAESIQGYMDFVFFIYADDEGNRKMLTQNKGPYRAKTRFEPLAAKLGAVVENPTLPAIYDLLCKTLKETK